MSVFSMENLKTDGFVIQAVATLYGGGGQSDDGLLLPKELPMEDKIVIIELIRRQESVNSAWEDSLMRFHDFAEIVCQHRPNPTFDQWIWLYRNLGCRHPYLPVSDACLIMAGREALWGFLNTVPDQRVRQRLKHYTDAAEPLAAQPLPHPLLEDAVQNDQPTKVKNFQTICHAETEPILKRALSLEKTQTVAVLLEEIPLPKRFRILIHCMEKWKEPMPLLKLFAEKDSDSMRNWRDPWGNSLFWYVYLREPIHRECAEFLFEVGILVKEKNIYGISAWDIWKYYRPRVKFT